MQSTNSSLSALRFAHRNVSLLSPPGFLPIRDWRGIVQVMPIGFGLQEWYLPRDSPGKRYGR